MRKVGSIAQLVMLIALTGFLSTSCKKTCDDGKKIKRKKKLIAVVLANLVQIAMTEFKVEPKRA